MRVGELARQISDTSPIRGCKLRYRPGSRAAPAAAVMGVAAAPPASGIRRTSGNSIGFELEQYPQAGSRGKFFETPARSYCVQILFVEGVFHRNGRTGRGISSEWPNFEPDGHGPIECIMAMPGTIAGRAGRTGVAPRGPPAGAHLSLINIL